MSAFVLIPSTLEDAHALADLRARVMRPSLEAVGRFDPIRARDWFLKSFDPSETWKIEVSGNLAGLLTLRTLPDHIYLDHLYIEDRFQGHGLGQKIVRHAQGIATDARLPLRLIALVNSPANRFYTRLGFARQGQDGVDVTYEWRPTA